MRTPQIQGTSNPGDPRPPIPGTGPSQTRSRSPGWERLDVQEGPQSYIRFGREPSSGHRGYPAPKSMWLVRAGWPALGLRCWGSGELTIDPVNGTLVGQSAALQNPIPGGWAVRWLGDVGVAVWTPSSSPLPLFPTAYLPTRPEPPGSRCRGRKAGKRRCIIDGALAPPSQRMMPASPRQREERRAKRTDAAVLWDDHRPLPRSREP